MQTLIHQEIKGKRYIVEVGSKKQFTAMQSSTTGSDRSEIDASCMHEYKEQDGGEMAG